MFSKQVVTNDERLKSLQIVANFDAQAAMGLAKYEPESIKALRRLLIADGTLSAEVESQ